MPEGFDSHYGKYQGPLAALAERWYLNGDFGDEEFSDSDSGEGSCLYRGLHPLSWSDAMYLREEFGATDEELTALDKEAGTAQGIVAAWDSQGFVYGWTLATVAELHDAERAIAEANEAAAAAEEG